MPAQLINGFNLLDSPDAATITPGDDNEMQKPVHVRNQRGDLAQNKKRNVRFLQRPLGQGNLNAIVCRRFRRYKPRYH
jgi:hypothetical protein